MESLAVSISGLDESISDTEISIEQNSIQLVSGYRTPHMSQSNTRLSERSQISSFYSSNSRKNQRRLTLYEKICKMK